MKSFNSRFLQSCAQASRSFRAYVVIEAPSFDLYLTSHSGIISVTPPDVLIDGVIGNVKTSSEDVKPENGISVLGGGSIELNNEDFISTLRDMFDDDETIYNCKTKIYIGDESLDIDDYQLVQTLYVKNINTTSTGAAISLKTSRFLTDKTIFTPKTAIITTSFTSQDTLTEIEVNSTDGFELVDHDSEYSDSPDEEVGYLRVTGSDANGKEVIEIIKWWSKDATHFYGDPNNNNELERACLNSGLVTATGQASGETATEITEYKYLELVLGKLFIAILTGELYGQAGKEIPAHWHCGIDSADIDLTSFEDIGDDLWNPDDDTGLKTYVDGLEDQQAQTFINREMTRLGVSLVTDQFGRLQAKRFSQVIEGTAATAFLSEADITNKPNFMRDSSDITNSFVVQWDYRARDDKFSRTKVLIDAESQEKNNIVSKAEILQFKLIRNTQLSVAELVNSITESLRSRKSSPAIKPSITTNLVKTAALQVMDIINVNLGNYKDFTSSDGVNRAFEIQSITTDWKAGTVSMRLYGASDEIGVLEPEGDIPTIDHTGWTEITTALTGSYTDVGGVLTLTGDCSLATGVGLQRYYYDGEIVLNGFTLTNPDSCVIDCDGFDARGSAIDGVGIGADGGSGITVADYPTFVNGDNEGGFGFIGNDFVLEGYNRTGILAEIIDRRTYEGLNYKTVFQYETAPRLNIRVDANNQLLGLPLAGLNGAGGTGSFPVQKVTSLGVAGYDFDGRDGGNGGSGMMIIADFFLADSLTNIDFSGSDGQTSLSVSQTINTTDYVFHGSSGGGGVGGALYVYIKDKNQLLPNNADSWFVSKNGITDYQAAGVGNDYLSAGGDIYGGTRVGSGEPFHEWPYVDLQEAASKSGVDFANARFRAQYLVSEATSSPINGIEDTPLSSAPENLQLIELIDTPQSAGGNISTVSATVDAPSDPNYSHTFFLYRNSTKISNYEMKYKVGEQSTFEAVSDGSTYVVTAIAVGKNGVKGKSIQAEITLKDVYTQPAVEQKVLLPRPSNLRLRNPVSRGSQQFKSGNAEFLWTGRSFNNAIEFAKEGLLGAGAGSFDALFKDYQVNIYDQNGKLKRQEFTTSESYTYTLEKNKTDNTGRIFSIEVAMRGSNNQVGSSIRLPVENPAPAAPTGLSAKPSYNQVVVDFVPPINDIDYKGVSMRYRINGGAWTAPFLFLAVSSCAVGDLPTGAEVEVELTSQDQFGEGGTSSIVTNTLAIDAAEIGDITSPLTLDEDGGVIVTNNSGFTSITGVADGSWNQLEEPTVYTVVDTNTDTQVFGVGIDGDVVMGNGDNSILFNGSTLGFGANVTIGSNENQTVTVGLGGDFDDHIEAVEQLSKIVPAYKTAGFTATIELLNGYVIDKPLHVKGLDLSWITITSSFTISVDSSALPVFGFDSDRVAFIGTDGARMPVLELDLIDDDSFGTLAYLRNGSYLKADSSSSFEDFRRVIVGYEKGTVIDFTGVLIEDVTDWAAILVGAEMSFSSGTLVDCANGFYVTDLGELSAQVMNSTLTTLSLFTIFNGGAVNANGMTLADAGAGGSQMIYVEGGTLIVNNAFLQVTSYISGTKPHIVARNSLVDMSDSTLLSQSGTRGVVNAYSSEVRAEGASDTDINIFDGTTVRAHNVTNSTFNNTTNTLHADGIIFN